MSEHISSLSEFLLQAGTEYRVFDMGRCIRSTDAQTFLEIENGQRVATFPRQQHAWFGIVYWNKQLSSQQYIWFLKLPLDEQGKVVDAARQHFLELVMTALAEQTQDQSSTLEKASQTHQNPYVFTPNQQQLASFNARSRIAVGASVTEDQQMARQYLTSPQVVDWQKVSLQGLADCVHFADEETLLDWLQKLNGNFPSTVKQHYLCALEDRPISTQIAQVIAPLVNREQVNSPESLWALRALAQVDDMPFREALITDLLTADNLSGDALTVIVGRHWQALKNDNMLKLLEHTARHQRQHAPNFFASLFADVAQLPDTRNAALTVLRSPERSQDLAAAIGLLFQPG